MPSRSSEVPNKGHKAPQYPISSIHHTPDGEDLASEAGNAASDASNRGASKASAVSKSAQAMAEASKPSWLDGIISSIKKPKQAEPPPPPPYPPPDMGSAQALRDDDAASVEGETLRSHGDEGGGLFSGAPYEAYEPPESEDGEGAAEAAALEALTSRIEAQVEARMKKKFEDAFVSPLQTLQQDLASMASAAAAKDEKINSLQAELEKQRWASEGFHFRPPSSIAEGKLTKSFGEPMTEAAKIIGAAVREAVEGRGHAAKASQGKRLSFMDASVPLFDFMKASPACELQGVPTAISVKEGLSSKPDINIKPDITNFYQACGEAKLMADFKDSLSHASFVDLRRKLVQRLAGLAYAQLEVADMEAASVTVLRHLLGSVRYFDGRSGYAKLSAVHTKVSADDSEGRELDTAGILLLIDKQFVSPTQVERDRELALELEKIKTAVDVVPSMAISQALLVHNRMYGPGQASLSERSTRSFITNMVTIQAATCPALQPFASKLLDAGFSGASLDD